MYRIERIQWEEYTLVQLFSEDRQQFIQIVPEVGGCLLTAQLAGVSCVDGYANAAELRAFDWAKSGLLAPFPNRLKDGRFLWEGQIYQFPINELTNEHAIHGFALQAPMSVQEEQADSEQATITCVWDYVGTNSYFPFPFKIWVKYQLSGSGLTVNFEVENTGSTAMPFGLGWHPYFQLGGDIGDCLLKMPPVHQVQIDERMIPTGELLIYQDFSDWEPIGDTVLDNCFLLDQTNGRARVGLRSHTHELSYWQTSGEQGFPYLQVFTPPNRKTIALEPMTCNVDAFNNGEGLRSLASGERTNLSCGLALRPL